MASDVRATIEEGTSDSSTGERSPQVRTRGPRGAEPKEQERERPNGRVQEAGTRVQVGISHDEDSVSESKLYPVEEFMQTFVRQEAVMWQKGGLLSIAESTSVLGSADNVSTISLPGSRALSLAGGEEEDNLTMVRYGKMTDEVHKYFKKLEKSHACMHLTGRKANFDNFRLPPLDGPFPAAQGDTEQVSLPEASVNQQPLVTLRDEELSLYQCALMCAQFPMLSAPGPPDGSSPTPAPPELPPVVIENPRTPMVTGTGALIERHAVASGPPDHDVIYPMSVPAGAWQGGASSSKGSGGLVNPGAKNIEIGVSSLRGVGRLEMLNGETHEPVLASQDKVRMKVASKSESRRHLSECDDGDEELMKLDCKPIKAGGREQPFTPMVNREMLCSLVRRAFLQSEEQQVQHDQILRHEHGRRSKGEILARELVSQLQALENNSNQFYKPKLFVTRNGYDLWLQSEKQRIKVLIDKFWHYSLPRPPQGSRLYTPTMDYHRAYVILLQKIICCESQTERKEPTHLGRTPSAPLSPTASRLLLEFSLRYGVGELFCKIVYLDYLARHFDYEVWYIRHCTEELRAIRDFFPVNKNKNIAVKKEVDMLRSTVHLLHGQTDNSLTRIDRLFLDSDPVKGVAALIELLKEVLDAEQSLFAKKVRSVEDWLKRYLKSGFELRYERQKEIASDEVIPDRAAKPFMLTPVLINALLLAIREEVHYYRENFQGVFRPYFDIVPFAQQEFYRLVCADAVSLAQRMIHAPETRLSLSLEMLGLMYRLNERDNEWKNVVIPERQNQSWRRQFTLLALIWMDVLGKQINQWVLTSISLDEWSLLSFKEHQARAIHSDALCSKLSSSVRLTPLSELPVTPTLTRPFGGKGSAFTAYRFRAPKAVASLTDIMSERSGSVSEWSSEVGSVESDLLLDTATEVVVQKVHASSSPSSSSDSVLLKFPHITTHTATLDDSSRQPKNSHFVEEEAVGRTQPASGGGALTVRPASGGGATPVQPASSGDADETRGSHHVGGAPVQLAPTDPRGSPAKQPAPIGTDPQGIPIQLNGSDPQGTPVQSNGSDPLGSDPQGTPVQSNGSDPPGTPVQIVRSNPTSPGRVICESPAPPLAHSLDLLHKLQMSEITRGSTPSLQQSQLSLLDASATHESLHKAASTLETPCNVPGFGGGGGGSHPAEAVLGEDEDGTLTPLPMPSTSSDEKLYVFPVSNSVLDLMVMLTRAARFTGTTLEVLSPKMRLGVSRVEREKVSQELPTEVTQAKQQVIQQQKDAENTKLEFVKKLHKVMIGAMKLYADNLACMDLCCCTVLEAKQYLGEQMVYHLKRRKEEGQIWGCRHTIEDRSGLHPNGLPCHKKGKAMFDNITRDMCVRMNNIHLLTSSFTSLESHLHSSMHVSSLKPFTAFGYVSGGEGSPLPHKGEGSSHRDTGSSMRDTWSSWVSSTDPDGLVPRPHAKGEAGFGSAESDQFLEYLRNIQNFQVQILCVRMNQFIKPAISLLLGLKLPNGTVEKRFAPLLSFVSRHCVAFEKYLYPDCLGNVLQCLWRLLVKDLEAEAMALRTSKDPVTEKARLLLHLTSLLMSLLHKKGSGVSLEVLTSSSEYLLGVLDIMTKSTDQLIAAFHKLSTFRMARSRVEVTKSLLYIDQTFIHSVRAHLHTYKKCFQGKDFVRTVIKLGEKTHSPAVLQSSSTRQAEPSPLVRSMSYTQQYAVDMGQHLLQQGALIEVPLGDHLHALNIPHPVAEGGRAEGAAIGVGSYGVSGSLERRKAMDSAPTRALGENTAQVFPTSFQGTAPFQVQGTTPSQVHGATTACFTVDAWYKFAEPEDSDSRALYASQVLCASSVSGSSSSCEVDFSQDMDKARTGSLFLVSDLLLQRSKERVAKQFLQTNSARNVLEQKRTSVSTSCDYIFKL